MEMIKKSIEDATIDELKHYGQVALGVNMGSSKNRETILAKIKSVHDGKFIEVDEASQVDMSGDAPIDPNAMPEDLKAKGGAVAIGKKFSERTGRNDPVVNLTVTADEKAGGDRHVFTSVNGVSFLIPRGEPVDVPYRYYLTLASAIKTEINQDENGTLIPRDIQVYPHQVNLMPPSDEIEAWKDAQKQRDIINVNISQDLSGRGTRKRNSRRNPTDNSGGPSGSFE